MKNKTYLHHIILILLIIISFFVQDISATYQKEVILVGYDKDYGIIKDLDSLDNRGFGYEILKRSEHYSNYSFEFIEYDYFDALDALRSGEIDLMGMVFQSDSYIDDFEFVPKIVGTTQLILATKSSGVYYDDPSAINGKTVASFHENPYESHLNEYCEKNNIKVNYIRGDVSDYISLDADYYLVSTIDENASGLNMVLNLEVFDLYFLVKNDNQTLSSELANAIKLAISADGNFLEELQIKYYGNKSLTRRYLTQSELDLLSSKTLVCGYIDHHQPIQYTNENGQPDGISVDVMNSLSAKYNFDIEYIAYNHNSQNIPDIHFDMLLSATGDFDYEMSFYTPSEPFMELPMMLLGKNDYIDQVVSTEHASEIGMLNYITLDHTDILKRYPNNKIISYHTFSALLDAYINGEVDAILATETGVEYAQAYLGEDEYTLKSTGLTLPLRIFFSNDSPNLTDYLGSFNIMFEHLEQSKIDEVMSMQSVRFLPEYTASDFIFDYLYIILLVIFLVLITIALTIFYHLHKRKSAILKIVNTDSLTNLISLYMFEQQAKLILQTAKPYEYTLVSIDIDSFRTINSIYTKDKGNLVINAVANALSVAFKHTDALICRVIADQFVILYKTSENIVINDICENYVSNAVKGVLGEKYNLSLSVGLCDIENTSLSIDNIIDCAVAARLKGKDKYVLTYHIYDDALKKELELKTSIVYRMKNALNNGEFEVFFQPKIRFDTLKVGGAEALVRWFDADRKMVSTPDVFIGIFESNGFIVNLDLYVFEQVCKFIVENEKDVFIPLISVNVSTITLFDEAFPNNYIELLKKYNLQANKIEIEITESAMTLDLNTLMNKANSIKEAGFYLSIDDFGAGASSLNRLNSIVADTLKLDKAFLDYNITEKRGAIVVDSVIKMAKQLKMTVVSEGVETVHHVKWLKSLGCDYAQGYYFERPLESYSFLSLLKSDRSYDVQ